MLSVSLKNVSYTGSLDRVALVDLEVPEHFNRKMILFVHGYMGFKDWGAWSLMQEYFVSKGFGFCKFNFTHNGIGLDQVENFTDLEAFKNNTYSKEVLDLNRVINFVFENTSEIDELILVGHSRGGGISILASADSRVSKLVTMAAISSIERRFSDKEMLLEWKNNGVRYVKNQRTGQLMPHSYAQVEDFLVHKEALSIEKACKNLKKPILILHGDADTSVSIEEGEELSMWTGVPLTIIQLADHVFGSSHPWNSLRMPAKLEELCQLIEHFLCINKPVKNNLS